ncbi:MAG: hypothetical protein DWQ44_01125 [Bacteroidetes bacterium]|nr:MAG: hypothetical protein DWQ33_00590 [Bacteroidota bacterium]REK04980.1 MAG: hypothetical protein DWQ39_07130 [Bacteroidota bacterium]REK36516.1 MAG: hypothetical protein DWQ44_01125 [Bacteroidota bacterium]
MNCIDWFKLTNCALWISFDTASGDAFRGRILQLRRSSAEQNTVQSTNNITRLKLRRADGFAFLEKYEEFPEALRKNCKVIVLSSSISPEYINKASINPYVVKYINKPLNEKYLDAIS